jgi:hypothetical protein
MSKTVWLTAEDLEELNETGEVVVSDELTKQVYIVKVEGEEDD